MGVLITWWRTSTRSGGNSDMCVEVAFTEDGTIAVRDSKDNGSGLVLRFKQTDWVQFLGEVKAGVYALANLTSDYVGTAIQVAYVNGSVALRSASGPDAVLDRFTTDEWDAFVAGVKDSEFEISALQADFKQATSATINA